MRPSRTRGPAGPDRPDRSGRPERTERAAATRPPVGRPGGPDPAGLAALLARTWLEVRAGTRPLHQLGPMLAPAVHRRLAAQLPTRPSCTPSPPRVVRVFSDQPRPGACEASVLVEQDGRTTAFAVRLERHRGAWRAVELTAPEAGLRPLPTASLTSDAPLRDAFDETADPTAGALVEDDLRSRDSA